jgi:hypothetical protein
MSGLGQSVGDEDGDLELGASEGVPAGRGPVARPALTAADAVLARGTGPVLGVEHATRAHNHLPIPVHRGMKLPDGPIGRSFRRPPGHRPGHPRRHRQPGRLPRRQVHREPPREFHSARRREKSVELGRPRERRDVQQRRPRQSGLVQSLQQPRQPFALQEEPLAIGRVRAAQVQADVIRVPLQPADRRRGPAGLPGAVAAAAPDRDRPHLPGLRMAHGRHRRRRHPVRQAGAEGMGPATGQSVPVHHVGHAATVLFDLRLPENAGIPAELGREITVTT